MQTSGDRLFIAPTATTAVEVLLLQVLLLLLLLLLVFTADADGGAATSVGGRRAVLTQAPEVFPAQIRCRLGLGGRRRDHCKRDGRVVDRYLVAAVTRIEVATVAGRRVRFARRVGRSRFGCGGDLVRQLRRRRVLDAARLPAAVHTGQRIVSGRTA